MQLFKLNRQKVFIQKVTLKCVVAVISCVLSVIRFVVAVIRCFVFVIRCVVSVANYPPDRP